MGIMTHTAHIKSHTQNTEIKKNKTEEIAQIRIENCKKNFFLIHVLFFFCIENIRTFEENEILILKKKVGSFYFLQIKTIKNVLEI